jgi:hypothetical protein
MRSDTNETAMRAAFLHALLRWAERANRAAGPIALPSGVMVDPAELLQCVVALKCANSQYRLVKVA